MSNELEELMHGDKRKKWKYSDLLEKYKSLLTKSAETYIPELFDALKEEHPDWTKEDFMSRIVTDLKGVNTESTIDAHKPDWMKSKSHMKAAAARSSNKIARQKAIETFEKAKEEIPESEESDEDNETICKGQPLDQWEDQHPEIAPSAFEKIGEVNKSLDRLWKALTGLKYMPTTEDDVRRDYIIPTRQFRKDFIKGSKKIERTFLYNWIEWVQMALNDASQIIEAEDNKK
jgi:hypothetical protein